jgi:DNA-binding CsgD family transcriptional regulator/PAS domain-containing protein
VLEVAPDGVLAIDRHGLVSYANGSAEEIFHLGRHELVGWPLTRLVDMPPGALRGGRTVDVTARRSDGAEVPVRVVVTRTDELPPRWIAWVRDLSGEIIPDSGWARREALFNSAEVVAHMGSWELAAESGELLWSDNLYRIYGYEPGAVTSAPELVFEVTHPDDEERVRSTVARLADTGVMAPLDYRIVLPGRGVRYVRATLAVTETRDGRPWRMVGSVHDLTEQRRAERETAVYAAVSRALAQWKSLDQGAVVLLAGVAEALEFSVGVLWLEVEDALVARALWRSRLIDLQEFEAATRQRRVPPGAGIVGRVWQSRQPVSSPNRPHDPTWWRGQVAARLGLRSAIAFPVLFGEEVLAVLEFHSTAEEALPDRLMESLTGVGSVVGQFLARRRGELLPPPLTRREVEVLRLAAQGLQSRQIATELVLSPSTVKTHFEHIYAKLEVGDRASAVATALRVGLID